MDEPRKSEMEFKDKLSKLFVKYKGRISRIRMRQFLNELMDELDAGGVRAV